MLPCAGINLSCIIIAPFSTNLSLLPPPQAPPPPGGEFHDLELRFIGPRGAPALGGFLSADDVMPEPWFNGLRGGETMDGSYRQTGFVSKTGTAVVLNVLRGEAEWLACGS